MTKNKEQNCRALKKKLNFQPALQMLNILLNLKKAIFQLKNCKKIKLL